MRDTDVDVPEREARAAARVAELSSRLRRAISDAGLSLREVEDRIGMGRDYLSQLLRGSVDLKLKHVFLILDAVGIDLESVARDRDEAVEAEIARTRRLFASPELDALIEEKVRAQMDPILRELHWPDRERG